MKNWKELSTNEKVMIGFAIVLLIILITQWEKTWNGVKKGMEPYKQEQTSNPVKE